MPNKQFWTNSCILVSSLFPVSQIGSAQLGAAALDALVKETNEWGEDYLCHLSQTGTTQRGFKAALTNGDKLDSAAFQTPPPCATTHQAPARQAPARQAPVSACRALDFNTSAQQVRQILYFFRKGTTDFSR